MKHFHLTVSTLAILVKSQGLDLESRKEIVIAMNSQEFPGKINAYKNSYKMFLILHFLTILTFKTKNAMRQNIPQVRVICAILHQKCREYKKTPLVVSMID